MACLTIPIPTIDLSLLLPTLSLTIPSPSLGLSIPCCNISFNVLLDMTAINAAIALIFAAAKLLAPVLAIIAAVVAKLQWALNKLADLIVFKCPLDYLP